MPTYDTPRPIRATFELGVAAVRLAAGERADTVVTVRPADADRDADVAAAQGVTVECSGGRLLIKGHKRGLGGLFSDHGAVEVLVELPAGSHVHGGLGMGSVRAAGPLGECRLKTGTGDVELEHTVDIDVDTGAGRVHVDRVAGSAAVATGSGNVELGEVCGSAVLKSANGDLRVGGVAGSLRVVSANGSITVGRAGASVVAKTAMGDVRIGEVARESAALTTAFGCIEVGVRAGTAARLDLSSGTGRVTHALEETAAPARSELTVSIRARTGAGDIRVHRAEPAYEKTL